jgi:hypothetical protein
LRITPMPPQQPGSGGIQFCQTLSVYFQLAFTFVLLSPKPCPRESSTRLPTGRKKKDIVQITLRCYLFLFGFRYRLVEPFPSCLHFSFLIITPVAGCDLLKLAIFASLIFVGVLHLLVQPILAVVPM